MKYLFLTITIFAIIGKTFGQTVYNDDQIIKISDYILELEKKDSSLKAELATIDQSMLVLDDEPAAPQVVSVCGVINGLKKTTFPIKDVNLQLIKENGEVLIQKTSNSGHFNFVNISPTENYTFKLSEEEAKTINANKIIISDCNGKTINTISKTSAGLFEYKVLDVDKTQLNTISDGSSDPAMKVKTLKENYKKMQDEVASSKACKGDYDALKAKYDALEKNYNALKSAAATAALSNDADEILKDPGQVSKYFKNIQFKTNDAKLDEAAIQSLNNAVVQLKKFKAIKFKIEGFADNTGTDSINKQLSIDRANTVKKYLISKGIKATRLTHNGLGSVSPIASNEDELGRAQNRRVEIRVK